MTTNRIIGSNVHFFVSGAIGSKATESYGVAVIGGDLVVSGTAYGNLTGTASVALIASQPTGNEIWVDSVFGNNLTGLRNYGDKPFLTVAAGLAAAQSGDIVHIRPGIYTVPPFTMPGDVTLFGSARRRCVCSYTATGSCTYITMTTGSIIRDLDFNLTDTGHHTLTGIYFGDGTVQNSFIKNCHMRINNSAASPTGSSDVTGILVQSTGEDVYDRFAIDVLLDISSSGLGAKRGVLLNTTRCSASMEQIFININSTGSINAIGCELSQSTSILRYLSGVSDVITGGTSSATVADISQTAGKLRVGSVSLYQVSCAGKAFTAINQAASLVWGDTGTVATTVRYMTPGNGGATATESSVQLVLIEPKIIQGLSLHLGTSPGGILTCTATLRKNGANTALTCTAVDGSVSVQDLTHAVECAPGDLISMSIIAPGGGNASANALVSALISAW